MKRSMSAAILVVISIIFLSGCLESGTRTQDSSVDASGRKTFEWITGEWGGCSTTQCGTSGTQLRAVICRDNRGNDVPDSLCSSSVGPKPATSQPCTNPPCGQASCTLDGVTVAHGQSRNFYNTNSVPCGSTCPAPISRTCNNGVLSGTASYNRATCTVAACAYTYVWETSNWGACSVTACGTSGTQSRTVVCKRNDNTTADDSLCITNVGPKPAASQPCTNPPCTGGTAPIDIIVTPSFETAGVIIKLPASTPNTASARLFIKKQSESAYKEAHPFTRYDANNMATSVFDLQSNTAYNIEVHYSNGTTTLKTASFNTKIDNGVQLPAATRTVNVANASQLQSALSSAQPGDHIVLANAVYNGVSISNKHGTAAAPIVIRGATQFDHMNPPANTNRAIINGGSAHGMEFQNSSNFIVHNVEVRNSGTVSSYGVGIYLRGSSKITVQNSYIHDSGYYNILIAKGTEMSGDLNLAGYHLIQNNFITDTTGFANCTGNGWDGCAGSTYYGVQINIKGGAGNVIRNNKLSGHVDNITPCGDEAEGRNLAENTAHVLRLTSSTGAWLNHDTEVYGNHAFGTLDDDIEADGICVNLRVYKNRLGRSAETVLKNISAHPLTIAPVMPGPIFIVKNIIENYKESAFKMNTGGNASIPIRNVYIYHNTFLKKQNAGSGAMVNLWYGLPNDHNVPVKNIQVKNNIFYAPNGSRCTDAYNQGSTHPTFNYNLWFTPTSSSSLYTWYNGGNRSASDLAGFRTISGQEANGLFGQPNLDVNLMPISSSPAIDKGVRIPGINDTFNGTNPDIGALEY